jgi:hypothetical protein
MRWRVLLVAGLFFLNMRCTAQWVAGGYLGEAHTLNSGLAIRQPALGRLAAGDGKSRLNLGLEGLRAISSLKLVSQ